jgi:amidophosphoribosyltransferase
MEPLKHECGVAMIRLLKPLEYYQEKYGTWMYGLNKLYLLMEKQHNRGQEGAGLACVKLEANPGEEYMFRERALGSGAITEIFGTVQNHFKDLAPEQLHDAGYAKKCLPFAGEVYMGHLRYSTTGKSGISYVHPFLRRNNWRAKNLALCGNFNMTNVDEIFARLICARRIFPVLLIRIACPGCVVFPSADTACSSHTSRFHTFPDNIPAVSAVVS